MSLRSGHRGGDALKGRCEVKRILITGAAGNIGHALRLGLRGRYPLLRLADIAWLGEAVVGEELCLVDIRDLAGLEKAMTGID